MSRMLGLWLLLYFGGLGLAIIHPFFPLIAYLAFYYMPPHLNWWGSPLPDLRYSLTAAAVLGLSVILLRSQLEPLKEEKNPAMRWFTAFGLNSVTVTAWALDAARSWMYTVVLLKLVILYSLVPAAVRTPAQFDWFGTAHVVGASYWGYKAWTNPKRESGRLMAVGGVDTQNDNQAAGHLLTVIPFIALYALTEKRIVRRAVIAVCGAFVINVFILCNSRGATVGLVITAVSAIFLAGAGRRKHLIAAAILGGMTVLYLADAEFVERQQTTTNAQDSSALSRYVIWRAGLEVLKDHPFGGGGRTFHLLSPQYLPREMMEKYDQGTERSPHNTFIQLATDWGVQGFLLFSIFLLFTFRMLHRIRKRAAGDSWYIYRSLAIQSALIGSLTAGFFSSRLYGESTYWMCALAFALYRIQSTELSRVATGTVAEPEGQPVVRIPPSLAAARRGVSA